MTMPDDPNTIPTVPQQPLPSGAPPAATPAAVPFWRRTWVRIAGAAAAAVILLGVGFGIGWAASGADDHGFSADQGSDGRLPGGPPQGEPGHGDGSLRPGDDRRGGHPGGDGSTQD